MEDKLKSKAREIMATSVSTNSPGKLFGKLFQLRDLAHLRHLKPTAPGQLGSGWEHKALNDLYEETLDIVDGIIESYQGYKGLVDIEIPSSKPIDIIPHLEELAKEIAASYNTMFPETWMQNQLDSIQELIYTTLYKLKNLK